MKNYITVRFVFDLPSAGVPADSWEVHGQGTKLAVGTLDEEIDAGIMDTFREEIIRYRKDTCMHFLETATAAEAGEDYILIGRWDDEYGDDKCMASPSAQTSRWFVHIAGCLPGAAPHELSHTVGMHHEQVRPDASREIDGHGPMLTFYWDSIPSSWKFQYSPWEDAYMGSDDEWAPYDFHSIMHYSKCTDCSTIQPTDFDTHPLEAYELTGNKGDLQWTDINQINDMYDCYIEEFNAFAVDSGGGCGGGGCGNGAGAENTIKPYQDLTPRRRKDLVVDR
jgi:hypothetical protein